MSYNLFLDDTRDPPHAYLAEERIGLVESTGITDWTIARDYNQFEFILSTRGLPSVVSFDHDLHFEHVRHFMNYTMLSGIIEYDRFKHKTGKHAADLLVNTVIKNNYKIIPRCYIHSANEYGRAQIHRALLRLTS